MKTRNYIKMYNSDNTLNELWSRLSDKQQVKLSKLAQELDDKLDKFKDNSDVAYSILMHLLNGKISLVEEEVTTKKLVAKQNKPFEPEDFNKMGEIKW